MWECLSRVLPKSFSLFWLMVVSGCATHQIAPAASPSYIEKVGMTPKIGESATAPVGGLMFSQFKYKTRTEKSFEYSIAENLNIGLMLGRVQVSSGERLKEAKLGGETVYCTNSPAYIDPLVGPMKIACFVDSISRGTFDKVKAAPGAIWFEKDLVPPLPYTRTENSGTAAIAQANDSFKYELLYQGFSRGSLKLAYLEYLKDLARPAFYQDVTYDFESKPTTITFRTVRIEISAADNNQIAYRVLSGF